MAFLDHAVSLANAHFENLPKLPAALYRESPVPERPIYLVAAEFGAHASTLYAKEDYLAFHNWKTHVVSMHEFANKIIEALKKLGVVVDEQVVHTGIDGHDLFVHLHESDLGFGSKEQLAGTYTYNDLKRRGAPEKFARAVESGIHATHVAIEPQTIEEKIIRAADLHNLGRDYEECKTNTLRLFEERRNTDPTPVTMSDFVNRSIKFLGGFLPLLIHLTPDALDERGASKWHSQVLSNLIALRDEYCEEKSKGRVIGDLSSLFTHGVSPIDVSDLMPNDIVLGFGDEKILRGAVKASQSSCPNATFLWSPGRPENVPLCDEMCDLVYIPYTDNADVLNEAKRIVKPNGQVVVRADIQCMRLDQIAMVSLPESAIEYGFSITKDGEKDNPFVLSLTKA